MSEKTFVWIHLIVREAYLFRAVNLQLCLELCISKFFPSWLFFGSGKIFLQFFFTNLVSDLQASPFVKYFNFKVSKQNFSKISYYNKFGAYDDIFAEFSGVFENSILDSWFSIYLLLFNLLWLWCMRIHSRLENWRSYIYIFGTQRELCNKHCFPLRFTAT